MQRPWRAHEVDGNPEGLDAETVLGRVGEAKVTVKHKVRDVFKHPKDGVNPARGTLIISVAGRDDRGASRYRPNLVK